MTQVNTQSILDEARAIAQTLERQFGLQQTDILGRLDIARKQADANAKNDADRNKLGRDQLKAQTAIERQKLAQAVMEMERIGVPRVQIEAWQAEKNYEIARGNLLLNAASTAAEMASRPDMYYQARQFQANVGRLLGDLSQPYQPPTGQPQQQTLEGTLQSLGQSGGSSLGLGGGSSGGAQGGDGVLKSLTSIIKASPPSSTFGLNDSDVATLNLLGAKYREGLKSLQPGTLETMDKNDLGFMKSAGTFLGFDPERQIREYQSTRPAQGNALGA